MSGDFPTFPQLVRIARDEVLIRSNALTAAVVDRPGTDANAMVAAGAVVGDSVVGQLVQVQAATYLSSAQAKDLDRLVFDRYGILRKPATPALGEVQFRTSPAVVVGFSIPIGTSLQTSDGLQFKTTATVLFPSGSAGPITVPVTSTLAGLNQNARPGVITSVPKAIPGAPLSLTASNALATVGAGDAETDEELRSRAALYYTTAQRGTLTALERGALATPGVRTATAYEATNVRADPARWDQVIIADQFTQQFVKTVGTTAGYETQAQNLAVQVAATLMEFRAAGMYVQVLVGVVQLVGITLALRVRAGFDAVNVGNQAKAFAQAYVNALSAGQSLVIADLQASISRAVGLEPLGGSVVSPTADMAAGPTQVFRTSTSLVTIGECFETGTPT